MTTKTYFRVLMAATAVAGLILIAIFGTNQLSHHAAKAPQATHAPIPAGPVPTYTYPSTPAASATAQNMIVNQILVNKLRSAYPLSQYDAVPVAVQYVGIAASEVDLVAPGTSAQDILDGATQSTLIFVGNPQDAPPVDSLDPLITGTTNGIPWAVSTQGCTDGSFYIKPATLAHILKGTLTS